MTRAAAFGEPIVTGEAVTIDLRTAGIGSRGLAFAVDAAVQVGLAAVLLWFVAAVGSAVDSASAVAVVLVAAVAIVLGYPVGFETLSRGRTPGKMVMGLRVVRDDGGPIRFRHAFVRGLVGVVVDRLGLSAGLLALVPMLVTRRGKRLGDLAAGTVVVQERVPGRVLPPPTMPAGLQSWAQGLDLAQVPDDLMLRIRQFLSRAPQLAPWAREEIGGALVEELTLRVGPPPSGVPPWAYFSAVLAERRRRELDRSEQSAARPETRRGHPSGHPPAPGPPAPGPPPEEQPPEGPFAPPL